jgi:hypothetical protein
MAGPLSRNPAHVGRWKCKACFEWYTSPPVFPWQDSHPNLFCSGCIVSRFDAALEFDFNWPASWGSIELNPQDFVSILPLETIARLTWKRTVIDAYAASTTAQGVEGLVRGEEFQNWPQFHKPIYLDSGCNHITCKCTASFCFRCGDFAHGQSNHWDPPDGCPRYGDHRLEPLEPVDDAELERRHQEHLRGHAEYAAERVLELEHLELQREEELFQANTLEIERRAWNVAMQNSSPALRHHMRGFALPQTDAIYHQQQGPNYPARQHWRRVMNAMQAYTYKHGVVRAEWATDLATYAAAEYTTMPRLFREFLLESLRDEHHSAIHLHLDGIMPRPAYHVLSEASLLRQPVGGVFNLNFIRHRVGAADWLSSRINLPAAAWPRLNHPNNFAILAIGPGGNAATRREAAEIMQAISGPSMTPGTVVHFRLAQHTVIFERVADSTVLSHVYEYDSSYGRSYYDRSETLVEHRGPPSAIRDVALLASLRELFIDPTNSLARLAELRAELIEMRVPVELDTGFEPGDEADDETDYSNDPGGDDADDETDYSSDPDGDDSEDPRSNTSDGGADDSSDVDSYNTYDNRVTSSNMGSCGRVSQLEGDDGDSNGSGTQAGDSDGEAPVPVVEAPVPVVEAPNPEVEALDQATARQLPTLEQFIDASEFLGVIRDFPRVERDQEIGDFVRARAQRERVAAAAAVVEAPESEASSSSGGTPVPVVEAPDPEAETLDQAPARREPTEEQFMADLQGSLALLNLKARDPQVRLAVLDVEAPNPRILLRGRLDEVIPPRAVHGDRIARREQVPREPWVERQHAQIAGLAARLDAFAVNVEPPRPRITHRQQDIIDTRRARARLDSYRAGAPDRRPEVLDPLAANAALVADLQEDILITQMANARYRAGARRG